MSAKLSNDGRRQRHSRQQDYATKCDAVTLRGPDHLRGGQHLNGQKTSDRKVFAHTHSPVFTYRHCARSLSSV